MKLPVVIVVGGLLVIAGAVAVSAKAGADGSATAEVVSAEPAAATAQAALDVEYRYAGGKRGREAVEAAVDEAVADMNVLIRGIARKKLLEVNAIIPKLGFSLQGDPLRASYIDGKLCESPADGRTVDWVNQYGDTVNLSQRYSGRTLVQRIFDDNGARTNTYRFSDDGAKMTMSVQITAKRLPKAVRYTLSYRRK